ncbi:MAG TPA: hypothetical protein VGG10_20725 [Rhizomicrobium sp.]|jgi:hypothetical protein
MSNTHWRKAITGDFAKSGKWDDGRPGIKDDAFITATGPDYTVKVIGADAAHTLTLNSVDATLLEKGQGSLHAGALDIEAGTAILTTANTIGHITMTGGELEFSNSAALGGADITISRKAVLAATGDAVLSNAIEGAFAQASFAAKDGVTLKLDGSLTFGDTADSNALNFIGTGTNGKGDGTGVIDLDGTLGAMGRHYVEIEGVTLGTSIANNSGFETMLSSSQKVIFDSNSVLDLTGQNDITLHLPMGTGEILNSGEHENLTSDQSAFGGLIQGDFDITMNGGGGIGGTMALKAGDVITVNNAAELPVHFVGDAPAINLVHTPARTFSDELSFLGATFSGAGPAVDLGTGQDTDLTIDHNFVGTIANFGGHNGGTDTITLGDAAGEGTPTIQYNPSEAGTGGELIVQYGTNPAYTLELIGSYTQADFKVNPQDPQQIECSAEQSAPHVPVHLVDALI